MARFIHTIFFLLTSFLMFTANSLNAQITTFSTDVDSTKTTSNIMAYVFCTTMDRANVGELTAKSPLGVSSTFAWEKYDTISGTFNPFNGYIKFEDTLSSTIARLDDGLYRVNINAGGTIVPPYQAYILNNWIEVTQAEIPDSTSDCNGFLLVGDFESAPLRYFDPVSSTIKSLRNPFIPFEVEWSGAGTVFQELISFSPPIADEKTIPFILTVTDKQFVGCKGERETEYESKIPKAGFTADPTEGEAVLKVTFSNESINYDSVMWFFYKNDSIIKAEAKEGLVDSIDFVLFDNAPVYEYEWCGTYRVKLVTVKINPTTGNCYDTIIGANITVEESLVEAPNVFTPNGDGANDVFAVKSKSLKSMSIRIYNRWGGLVHSWSYSNIRGRDYTYKHSVWDGRIGSRMASPGVYFYVIRAVGRDGVKQNKEGFVHLFRDKN